MCEHLWVLRIPEEYQVSRGNRVLQAMRVSECILRPAQEILPSGILPQRVLAGVTTLRQRIR